MEQLYPLKDLIEQLEETQSALLLRCALDRVPIIITGNSQGKVDRVVNRIISLMPHRQTYHFSADFTTQEDYLRFLRREAKDLRTPRLQFISLSSSSPQLIGKIDNLTGWIIGCDLSNGWTLEEITKLLQGSEEKFLLINLNSDEIQSKSYGLNLKYYDLSFEKQLIERVTQKTTRVFKQMQSLLSHSIKVNLSEKVKRSFTRLEVEEDDFITSLLTQEVRAFVEAANRARGFLARMDLLRAFGFPVEISDRELIRMIDYKEKTIKRLLELIQVEYNSDFIGCVRGNF